MNHELKLLVEWSSPWEEFLSSLLPALRKSPKPLSGEAPTGLLPFHEMVASLIVEAALIVLVVVLPSKLATLRPAELPPMPKYDVIYFSGDELPQTEDAGGSKAGRSGRAGGHEAHHRTQTIRVSRGEALRQVLVDAPNLDLPKSTAAVANLLAYKTVPGPAPTEGLKPSMRAPGLADAAVAPTPEIEHDKMRSAPALSAAVVPPSPSGPQRDLRPLPIPGSQMMSVVPPPVSAPEQTTNLHPLLTLPPQSIIAPPPTQVTRNVATRGPGFGPGELQKQVVPPPVSVASTAYDRHSPGGLGSADVVPPPVQMSGAVAGRTTVPRPGSPNVVAPPVQVDGTARGRSMAMGTSLGAPSVVPPPVQAGTGSLRHGNMAGLSGGGVAVVPPPPTISGDASASGFGRGSRGNGLGGPLDAGSVGAPPSNTGGNIGGNGIVVSSQPGSKVGAPGNSGTGSLALSPRGGDKLGSGEAQGGAGIASGEGPGSGFSGSDGGGARSGEGRGSDTTARGGISPYPGSGGAGTGNISKPPIPGVSVHGGNNVITLPSFGSDGSSPSVPGRSLQAKNEGPDITVVGTSRSGGALNRYGELKGDKVYTIYIDTTLGTAIMEFADPTSTTHPYGEDLTAPTPLRAGLPANLQRSRLLISCTLDRSGLLRDAKVLEGNSAMNGKILAALSSWKFRPAFRGDQAVEVTAILGFDIDTR
ncbi:MAG: hypothetical protein WB952_05945 [Terriglobales bacterium]